MDQHGVRHRHAWKTRIFPSIVIQLTRGKERSMANEAVHTFTYPRAGSQLAFARMATALAWMSIGGLAVGAMSIGALAIRALAVKRLALGKGTIGRLKIEELEVGRLHVRELVIDTQAPSARRIV
jgi:hypothetical protein